jgi:hypothetical protein
VARGEVLRRRQSGKQRSRGCSEVEEEGKKSKDWFGKLRKLRGLSVN